MTEEKGSGSFRPHGMSESFHLVTQLRSNHMTLPPNLYHRLPCAFVALAKLRGGTHGLDTRAAAQYLARDQRMGSM